MLKIVDEESKGGLEKEVRYEQRIECKNHKL